MGNACIHGILCTTHGSIAYITTQVHLLLYEQTHLLTYDSKVCFALSLSSVFSCTDKICDSEHFFNSLLEVLYDPEEQKEVEELLSWQNRWVFAKILLYLCHLTCTLWFSQVFPNCSNGNWTTSSTWVFSKIKQRRAVMKKAAEGSSCTAGFSSVVWASHCSFMVDIFEI